jgi:hypothetical protein
MARPICDHGKLETRDYAARQIFRDHDANQLMVVEGH